MYEVVGMFVYESTEGEAVPPAGGHVSDPHPGVVLHLPPAPLLQGRHSQKAHLLFLYSDDRISIDNADHYSEERTL